MAQERKRQKGRPNVHKAPGRSQLSKNDTGALARNGPTRPERTPSHETARPERAPSHGPPDRMMAQERKWKKGHPNVHKALERSQLSKNDTGTPEEMA